MFKTHGGKAVKRSVKILASCRNALEGLVITGGCCNPPGAQLEASTPVPVTAEAGHRAHHHLSGQICIIPVDCRPARRNNFLALLPPDINQVPLQDQSGHQNCRLPFFEGHSSTYYLRGWFDGHYMSRLDRFIEACTLALTSTAGTA